MKERAQPPLATWRSPNVNENGWGLKFWALTCPISQNTFFPKWVVFPIRIWPPYLSHPKENYLLNQFRAEINDWHKKTKWVVDSFMGSPFEILLYPIGSRVWISPPPYSFWNHAPISLMLRCIASCGIFINCIVTWCLKTYCASLVQKPSASILITET